MTQLTRSRSQKAIDAELADFRAFNKERATGHGIAMADFATVGQGRQGKFRKIGQAGLLHSCQYGGHDANLEII
ncbi:hypothetical protein WBP06_06520 [Novosphingobium sp. BL-8H]|uniref:hypothetical protein n=1 Tax=Novosphingobium sp. BL-8H TaxID=3127640 RepID=UPI003757D498